MINRHHVTQRLYGASVRCSTLALSLLIREKVKDGKLDKWSLGPVKLQKNLG
jgi:ABC-type transport system involved in cytochrome c biogenesis permease component